MEPDEFNHVQTFVRTKDGGWFSMGFLTSGRLDIDGTLTEQSNKYLNGEY